MTVITAPSSAVLVWNGAPPEIRERPVRDDAEGFNRIDLRAANRAEMCPVIAQVEHRDELLTEFEAGQVEAPLVQNGVVELWVRASDSRSVTELELV